MNNDSRYVIASEDLVSLRTAVKLLIDEYNTLLDKSKHIPECKYVYMDLINTYQKLEQKTRYSNLVRLD